MSANTEHRKLSAVIFTGMVACLTSVLNGDF